ncbi:hypothetical protein [Microcoleus vaginatus]|uniref:hypothetical protein n=1 Tax=Microcoleus vaginatus TaxID=119532 RepID=UPI001F61865A
MLGDSGIFDSADLRYPIWRAPDKQRVLPVTPFGDFGNVWNPRGSAVLEANTLLSEGLRL